MGKQLIERKEIFEKVVNGHDYALLEGNAHRIHAPEDNQCYAIIFWTKDGPRDNSPSSGKIVTWTLFSYKRTLILLTQQFGGVIYGLDTFSRKNSFVNPFTLAECKATERMIM